MFNVIRRINFKVLTGAILLLMLLGSLVLMNAATQNAVQFEKLYSTLLIINISGLVVLILLISASIIRLVSQYYRQSAGARLTLKLVLTFAVLSISPVIVVYYFSLDLLEQGVDSWFDIEVEQALGDSLDLGRSSLDNRKAEHLKQTVDLSKDMHMFKDIPMTVLLNELRNRHDILELTLFSADGKVVSVSSADSKNLVPSIPTEAQRQQARTTGSYVALDSNSNLGLLIKVLVYVPGAKVTKEGRFIQALYPVRKRIQELTQSVETAYVKYKELNYMRQHLKFSFILTLSLVLLLSFLGALWAAIYSARRLVAPISSLAAATRAVAAGHYDKKLPFSSKDELGFLVESFNDMTRRIASARDEAKLSQFQVETQKTYLQSVLSHLSTGVLSLDADLSLRTVNSAASQILDVDLETWLDKKIDALSEEHQHLEPFVTALMEHMDSNANEWTEQIDLGTPNMRHALICRGSALRLDEEELQGYVVVFDDITQLLKAQREAAWGEVARRLAHEIKNPLTPIQLSAERLRHKYLNTMSKEDAQILDRSTHTIVQQVETMKEMVKAFSEYALGPQLTLAPLNINAIINEVLDLYDRNNKTRIIKTEMDLQLPLVLADAGRLRQLLHNLVKNALEALEGRDDGTVTIKTHLHKDMVEIRTSDNGPGIPEEIFDRLFEPYVTTKTRGSGLGLAIVKKIVEEHGGNVYIENQDDNGTCVVVRLPADRRAANDSISNENII